MKANMKSKYYIVAFLFISLGLLWWWWGTLVTRQPAHSDASSILPTKKAVSDVKSAMHESDAVTLVDGNTGKEVVLHAGEKYVSPASPNLSSDITPEDQARWASIEADYQSMLQLSPVELISQWQNEVLNPQIDADGHGVTHLENMLRVLTLKLRQVDKNDPAYAMIRDIALNSTDIAKLTGTGILLGKVATPEAVAIANAMISKYKGATVNADDAVQREGLGAGYAALQNMGSTLITDSWAGKQPPPLVDGLQQSWEQIVGMDEQANITRGLVATTLAKEGTPAGVEFLLNTLGTTTEPDTRKVLHAALQEVRNPKVVPVLEKYLLSNTPETLVFQGSASALVAMKGDDNIGAKTLLKWAQIKATDGDAPMVKQWFEQAYVAHHENLTRISVIAPMVEASSFQSEAVKTAVLEGIAEQERQLSPQASPAQ